MQYLTLEVVGKWKHLKEQRHEQACVLPCEKFESCEIAFELELIESYVNLLSEHARSLIRDGAD